MRMQFFEFFHSQDGLARTDIHTSPPRHGAVQVEPRCSPAPAASACTASVRAAIVRAALAPAAVGLSPV